MIPERLEYPLELEIQTFPYTCSSKLLQLILHFYMSDKYPLGKEMELSIYGELTQYGKKHPSPLAVAWFAAKEGFDVLYVASTPDLFIYPENAKMSKEEFERKLKEDIEWWEKAQKFGAKLEVIKEVTPEYLKEKLYEYGPCFAMIEEVYGLHAVCIYGYDKDLFRIFDPTKGKKVMGWEELKHFLHTRYGISLTFVGKPRGYLKVFKNYNLA